MYVYIYIFIYTYNAKYIIDSSNWDTLHIYSSICIFWFRMELLGQKA